MLDIADVSGLPEYAALRAQQYGDTDIFILIYAIGTAWSYESLPSVCFRFTLMMPHAYCYSGCLNKWIEEMRRISNKAPFILVGCKSDLRKSEGETLSVVNPAQVRHIRTLTRFRLQ